MRFGDVEPCLVRRMPGLIRWSALRRPGQRGAIAARSTLVAVSKGSSSIPKGSALKELLRDDLTDLGSLLSLREHLEPILDQYQPFGARPALLLMDLDGFRRINSAHGRSRGDQVLVDTAARLRTLVPGADATYRTGGDEFVALLDPTSMIDAVAWAGRIHAALGQPIEVDGLSISVRASIAVVMLGQRRRIDGLLRDADVTMYRAKAEGGNRVDVYNWELDSWSTARKREVENLAKEVEELRLQNRVLAEAMTLDLDTGLPNALAFEADHSQLDAWRHRSGETYAMLRARVDDLDTAQQHFRSPEGTKALTSLAKAIRDTVRQSDRAYVLDRGDYAVLLTGSGVKQAVAAAERILSRVDNLAIQHPADPCRRLTVTVAAIEAGFRHSDTSAMLAEVNELLRKGAGIEGVKIIWPR
jgi:diguanylate cyclase (GGDEF)-like protein